MSDVFYETKVYENGVVKVMRDQIEYTVASPTGISVKIPEHGSLSCAASKPITVSTPRDAGSVTHLMANPVSPSDDRIMISAARGNSISSGTFYNTSINLGNNYSDGNKAAFAAVFRDFTPSEKGETNIELMLTPPFYYTETPRHRQDNHAWRIANHINDGINSADIVAQNAANAKRHAQNLKAAGVQCNQEDAVLSPAGMVHFALANLGQQTLPALEQDGDQRQREARLNRDRDGR